MAYRYLALVVAFVALVGGMVLLRADEHDMPTSVLTLQTDIPSLMNYRDSLVHYATVGRPDARSRDIYITAGAAEQVAGNSTARLPSGTVIVIEAHQTRAGQRVGLVDHVDVAVKRDNWTAADYDSDERAGDWNFFSFDPSTGAMSTDTAFACFDCHANNSQIDFIFSRDELAAYGATGDVQTSFCNRPDRLPCN